MRGLPDGGPEQLLDVERLALGPGRGAGRGEDVVQRQGQAGAVLGGEERLEVEHPHLVEGRLLHALDQRREVEVLPRVPGGEDQLGEEDVLAALHRVGLDARQGEQSGHRALDAGPERLVVVGHRLRGRGERAEERQRPAGLAARGVDRHLAGVAEAGDALAVLVPVGQPLLPGGGGLGCELLHGEPLTLGVGGVDPGLEVGRGQVGEGEGEVGQVALGVDGQGGDAVDGRLLEETDAEAGLAAAGHAHAEAVGGEVLGVVEQQLGEGLLRLRVPATAQVEDTQLLVVLHRSSPGSGRWLQPGRTPVHAGGAGQGVGGKERLPWPTPTKP